MQQYLEEYVMKSFAHKSQLLTKASGNKPVHSLRRKMSVRGAIKKTRSINVDCNFIVFEIKANVWYLLVN